MYKSDVESLGDMTFVTEEYLSDVEEVPSAEVSSFKKPILAYLKSKIPEISEDIFKENLDSIHYLSFVIKRDKCIGFLLAYKHRKLVQPNHDDSPSPHEKLKVQGTNAKIHEVNIFFAEGDNLVRKMLGDYIHFAKHYFRSLKEEVSVEEETRPAAYAPIVHRHRTSMVVHNRVLVVSEDEEPSNNARYANKQPAENVVHHPPKNAYIVDLNILNNSAISIDILKEFGFISYWSGTNYQRFTLKLEIN
jgi:hypothetical protein